MAHKKGVGSSKNGRESESKRLGVKLFGGEFAKAGNIIVRQRGTTHHPGENTGIGRDHSIYALIDGVVVFRKTKNNRSFISIQGGKKNGECRMQNAELGDMSVVEAVVEAPEAEAVVEAVAEEPVAEAVVEAVAEAPVAEDVVEAVVEEPVAEAVVEVVAEVPVTEAVVETVTEAPVEEVVVEAVAEAPMEETVVEAVAEAPVAEAPVAEAVVEAVAEVPVVEKPKKAAAKPKTKKDEAGADAAAKPKA